MARMDRSRRGGMKGRKVGPNRIQEKFKTHWDVGKPRKSGEIRISPYIHTPDIPPRRLILGSLRYSMNLFPRRSGFSLASLRYLVNLFLGGAASD